MNPNKQLWQALINEQQQSKLSIAAFCRDRNIKAENLYYHRSQHLKKIRPSSFVQARSASTEACGHMRSRLILQCGENSQLQLSPEVPVEWLAGLIKALA